MTDTVVLPNHRAPRRGNTFIVPLLVVLLVAGLFVAQSKGLLAITAVYAASGPLYWVWTRLRRRSASP